MNVYEALQYMVENPLKSVRSKQRNVDYYYTTTGRRIVIVTDETLRAHNVDVLTMISLYGGEEYEIARDYQTLPDLFCRWLEGCTIKTMVDGEEWKVHESLVHNLNRNNYMRIIIDPEMAMEKRWWVE